MAKTKYLVRHNGEIIGTRSSDRTYTHAIARAGVTARAAPSPPGAAGSTWPRASCASISAWASPPRSCRSRVPAKPACKPVIEDPDRRALFQPDFSPHPVVGARPIMGQRDAMRDRGTGPCG